MKLTKTQIQQLYTFTQKHYVDWYDVQTELVDHLANGIEEHLELNPNTTFESALNSEFKKFGIMGFNDVIEEKTKALNKHYRKLVWMYFRAFFMSLSNSEARSRSTPWRTRMRWITSVSQCAGSE